MRNPAVYTSSEGAPTLPPAPIPALTELHRTPDPGSEQRGLVRLNRNERVQPLPDWFIARVRDAIDDSLLAEYPPSDELYRELSASLGVETSRLLITAGSDGAIKALYQAYVRPGDGVVALDPSYAMYGVYAQMFQARLCEVPIGADLIIDGDRLLDAIQEGVRLVMIANPNQPTGTVTEESLLAEVLERAAGVGALVAVDEAYYPFSNVTMLARIHEFSHLVVTRTFSKAAGLAGLRIGFAAGHPEVISSLWKVRSAHDVNSVAIACAREILRSPEVVTECVSQVELGQRVLAERVAGLGLEPLLTPANFMLIRVAPRYSSAAVVETLRELGYLVRGPFSAQCMSGLIRVTLGPPRLMAAFADALAEALSAIRTAEVDER